jgi:uncharacterized protein
MCERSFAQLQEYQKQVLHWSNKNDMKSSRFRISFLIILSLAIGHEVVVAQEFRAISFFTARHDPAHISFVREAHAWFQNMSVKNNFIYDTTSNWGKLNRSVLSKYDVVIFLDTRPEEPAQRQAFQEYMESGGSWMGFHFAAFSLADSRYPDNWPWYHNEFIKAGQYKSNTWRPTAELLKVHSPDHPSCKNLSHTFMSAPNEWYRWEKDLATDPDIEIILSLDKNTFPVGTGPKAHEIWHSGFYPVAWVNKKFKMMYMNMGHNDMDYGGTESSLSSTFSSKDQCTFILQTLLWLGKTQ